MKKNIKKTLKIISLIVLWLFIIWQSYALYIDIYNFKQLEKAKPILEWINKDDKKFYWIKEFNAMYNIDLKPIKNCYSIWRDNWNFEYLFGFKLESFIYIFIYKTRYFAFPKYDTKISTSCVMNWWCIDLNKTSFKRIISNPCED
jgi:hypothetical protein